MKKPKWYCPACGMGFTRRWNAIRHITNLHAGVGQPLLGTGEQAGVGFQNQQSALAMNPSDSIQQLRQYELDYGITMGFPDLLSPSWVSKARTLIDRILSDHAKEHLLQFYSRKYNQYSKKIVVDPAAGIRIVGYRGMVCERCLAISALEVMEQDDKPDVRVRNHRCEVRHIYYSPHERDERKRAALKEQLNGEELPALMSLLIQRLEKKLEKTRYLYAEHIDFPPDDASLALDIDRYEMKGSYLKKAVLNGHAHIDNQDLLDFMKRAQSFTFRTFRVRFLRQDSLYLIGVSFTKKNISQGHTA